MMFPRFSGLQNGTVHVVSVIRGVTKGLAYKSYRVVILHEDSLNTCTGGICFNSKRFLQDR